MNDLHDKMNAASEALKFEEAKEYRDLIKHIEMLNYISIFNC